MRSIVITGAGRAFCTGADLTGNQPEDAELEAADGYRRVKESPIGRWGLVVTALGRCTKPVIAAVNGVCAGGGLSLALAADIRIASTEARFISIFIRRAIPPDTGTSFHLPQLIGPARAFEMMLTGDEVGGEEAAQWGLVNRVVEPAQLLPEAMALATRIANGPAVAMELTKRLVLDATREGLERQLQNEGWAMAIANSAEDRAEGIAAFVERRQPRWTGR